MSRYIDAEALKEKVIEIEWWNENTGFYEHIDIVHAYDIDDTPTADVVEVVRCKDCKYLYCLSAIDRQFYCRHFPKGLHGINIIEDNPYCSYGERREE